MTSFSDEREHLSIHSLQASALISPRRAHSFLAAAVNSHSGSHLVITADAAEASPVRGVKNQQWEFLSVKSYCFGYSQLQVRVCLTGK